MEVFILDSLERFGIDPKASDIEAKTIYSLACLFSVVEKQITDYLKEYNLSPSQFNALMIIKHVGLDKGLSQVDIGDRLIVTASNMTRLLDKLKKDDLVERLPQANDRRVNLVKITDKGSDLLDRAWPGYSSLLKEIGSNLSNSELKTLSTLQLKWFEKLNKNL